MNREWTPMFIGFFIIIAAIVGYATFQSWSDCNERGGAWVDGVVWYECVESAK